MKTFLQLEHGIQRLETAALNKGPGLLRRELHARQLGMGVPIEEASRERHLETVGTVIEDAKAHHADVLEDIEVHAQGAPERRVARGSLRHLVRNEALGRKGARGYGAPLLRVRAFDAVRRNGVDEIAKLYIV